MASGGWVNRSLEIRRHFSFADANGWRGVSDFGYSYVDRIWNWNLETKALISRNAPRDLELTPALPGPEPAELCLRER